MDSAQAERQLATLQRLHGKNLNKLEKNSRFRKAVQIIKDITEVGSAAATAYKYGPRAVQGAVDLVNNVISYGTDYVQAVQYLNNPDNYLISVTEDDYVPIGEDDEMFALDLESGETAIAEVSLPEDISIIAPTAEETGGGFFSPLFDTITSGEDIITGDMEGINEAGDIVSTITEIGETAVDVAEVAETVGEAVVEAAEVAAVVIEAGLALFGL